MGVYTGIAADNVTINSGTATLQSLNVTNYTTGPSPVTKTANFTVANTENFIVCNGAGTITATLPSPAAQVGRQIRIKTIAAQAVISASSNVQPLNSATPGTAILAGTAGASAQLVSNGTHWIVMA
jgi:hypothetical protein